MTQRMQAVNAFIGVVTARFMLARYLVASLCALSTDMLTFLTISHLGTLPVIAAFGGYVVGMGVHWMLSVRFVFPGGVATHAHRIGFVLSSLLGMVITMGMVGALSGADVPPSIAKLAAIPISFFSIYAIRKYAVFAAR